MQELSSWVKSAYILCFSGPYFPAFRLNTEIYRVNLRVQYKCWKIQTRKTSNTDTFYAVHYIMKEFVFIIVCFLTLQRAKNVNGCQGKFKDFDTGNYTFSGDGFVNFETYGRLPTGFERIELLFATLEENGLLFFGSDSPENGHAAASTTFNSLEIEDGYLISKFDFGDGFQKTMHTAAGKLNDGKPHAFLMKIGRSKEKKYEFHADGKEINQVNVSKDSKLGVKEVFIGGLPVQYKLPHL